MPNPCRNCGEDIPWQVRSADKIHSVNTSRGYCLKCRPLRLRASKLRLCTTCKQVIPPSITIDGKRRCLAKRRSCLECLPFGHPGERPHTWKGVDLSDFFSCKQCKRLLAATKFEVIAKRNGRQTIAGSCRECVCAKRVEARRAVKAWAVLLLGGKCAFCPYAKNLASLDFHHVDGKESNISELLAYGHGRDRTRLEKELRKCQLVCRNCHNEKHFPDACVEGPEHLELMAKAAFTSLEEEN